MAPVTTADVSIAKPNKNWLKRKPSSLARNNKLDSTRIYFIINLFKRKENEKNKLYFQ